MDKSALSIQKDRGPRERCKLETWYEVLQMNGLETEPNKEPWKQTLPERLEESGFAISGVIALYKVSDRARWRHVAAKQTFSVLKIGGAQQRKKPIIWSIQQSRTSNTSTNFTEATKCRGHGNWVAPYVKLRSEHSENAAIYFFSNRSSMIRSNFEPI